MATYPNTNNETHIEWKGIQKLLLMMIPIQLVTPIIIVPLSHSDSFMLACFGVMIIFNGLIFYRIYQNKQITKSKQNLLKTIIFLSPLIVFGLGFILFDLLYKISKI